MTFMFETGEKLIIGVLPRWTLAGQSIQEERESYHVNNRLSSSPFTALVRWGECLVAAYLSLSLNMFYSMQGSDLNDCSYHSRSVNENFSNVALLFSHTALNDSRHRIEWECLQKNPRIDAQIKTLWTAWLAVWFCLGLNRLSLSIWHRAIPSKLRVGVLERICNCLVLVVDPYYLRTFGSGVYIVFKKWKLTLTIIDSQRSWQMISVLCGPLFLVAKWIYSQELSILIIAD